MFVQVNKGGNVVFLTTVKVHLSIRGKCRVYLKIPLLVWFAITEYHRLSGLNSTHMVVKVLLTEKFKTKSLADPVWGTLPGLHLA